MASAAGSFVAEVLSSAGHMEREEINEKLSRLGQRMEELKLEIQGATTSSTATFSDFESNFDVTTSLSDKVRNVSEEMEELQHKVETEVKGQLKVSTGEFQSLRQQQEQLSMLMEALTKLNMAKQLMDSIVASTSQQRYTQAACSLAKLEKALAVPTCEREDEIKILAALHNQQCMLKSKLIWSLDQAWDTSVSLRSLDPDDKPKAVDRGKVDRGREKGAGPGDEQDMRQWELRLPQSDSTQEQEALKEMVNALEQLGQLNMKVQSLGRQLLKYIFPLTLSWQKVVVTETPLATGKQVLIKAEGERRLPRCVDVFSVLGNLLDLLHDSLLHVTFSRQQDEQDCSLSLMNLLGDEIGEKILDGIVKKCLSHAIPSSQKELESFHEVIAVTKTFQDHLVSLGFVGEGSRTLLDFVNNVNVLFANKKCQTILERARSLMTSDIHDTVLILADASPGELAPLDKSGGPSREKSRKMEMSGKPLLNNSMFRMPTCRVSMCIQELLDLVYSTLNEAASSSPQCSVQLFYTVRNIFELFISVFPTYHAHSLANFPQLSALHHNNCMFLAHHLLTLGHQFKQTMPSDVSGSFVDLIPEIRKLGSSSFMEQMNTQKAILEQYIEGAAGFSSVDEEDNYDQAERSVKQALHQLTHLQKVWQDVLPASNYRKAIGMLLRSLMTHMMEHMIALEDISSEAARKLFLLLKMVDERAQTLFQTEEQESSGNDSASTSSSQARVDLQRHVPRYAKFTELQLLLNGSMQEISDRWADGMGPLAAEFPASEVKQLIRALFQNTDRRAAVLAKIK